MFYTFLILCSILLVLLPIAWIISLIRFLYARWRNYWFTDGQLEQRKRTLIVVSVTCGAALLVFGIFMLVISYSAIAYM